MNYKVKTTVVTDFKYHPETRKSQVLESYLSFETEGLIEDNYRDSEGYANKDGVEITTNGLVQGLVNNIHYAHQNGLKDSATHLREIIALLEQGFSVPANVEKKVED